MTTNPPIRVILCHVSSLEGQVMINLLRKADELYQKLRAEPWIQPWLDEEELLLKVS